MTAACALRTTKVTRRVQRRAFGYALLAGGFACLGVGACSKRETPERELRRTMNAMHSQHCAIAACCKHRSS